MSVYDDSLGQTFAELTVIELMGRAGKYHHRVKVRCSCGAEKSVLLADLRSGATVTCGNRTIIDVKSRNIITNRSLVPSIVKSRTKHASKVHYLFIENGAVIGFWRPRADGWPGTERYWPLDCPDPL